jgi:hypothetical protein
MPASLPFGAQSSDPVTIVAVVPLMAAWRWSRTTWPRAARRA